MRYFPCSLIIRYLSSPTFITLCAVFIGEEMVCRIVYNQAAGWDVRRCFFLCLVLYEFSTYIGNDMIQPGMLAVVEQYQACLDWVPTSMTAYLAGGMFLQWLLGPLSDRIGRRPVMLAGVVWFIVTCLATLLAKNIEQFTFLRFCKGLACVYRRCRVCRDSGVL